MRKILIPLVFAPVAMFIAFLSGCGGGGDSNPKFKDKAPTELEKKLPAGGGAKPQAN